MKGVQLTAPQKSRHPFRRGLGVLALSIALVAGGGAGTLPAAQATPPVKGAIGQYYRTNARAKQELGNPTATEVCNLPFGGCSQAFQKGTIYWSPRSTTTHLRTGEISKFYRAAKGPAGIYGYPMTPVTAYPLGSNGFYAKTKNPGNGTWYWLTYSTDTGVVPVKTTGAIGAAWERNRAVLGYPMSAERAGAAGVYSQRFSKATLVWSAAAGAHPVKGAIGAAYLSAFGGPTGSLGAPTGDEVNNGDGTYSQQFKDPVSGRQSMIVWGPRTGAKLLTGAIRGLWSTQHGTKGPLGAPTGNEISGLRNGGVSQDFTGGKVYWSPATGAHSVLSGRIMDAWRQKGAEKSDWGYPTSEPDTEGGVTSQDFQGGQASFDSSGRVQFITWDAVKAAAPEKLTDAAVSADLGAPVSDAGPVWSGRPGTISRAFEKGTVVYTHRYGAVPMSPEVYRQWQGYQVPSGLPTGSHTEGDRIVTDFEKQSLAYFPDRGGLVMRTDTTLTSKDALVVGDSQVWDTFSGECDPSLPNCNGSWTAQAIKRNGFTISPASLFRQGGVGFTTDNSTDQYGTYTQTVVDNRRALPVGTPGVIYVEGSGNDGWYLSSHGAGASAKVKDDATRTIQKLKAAYPKTKIVLTGVVSGKISPNRENRLAVEQIMKDVAQSESVTFVPLAGKIDEWKVESHLRPDHTHFYDYADQGAVADHYAPYLRGYLR